MHVLPVTTLAVLVTLALGAVVASLVSAVKVTGSDTEHDSVRSGPLSEEVVFRCLPAILHAVIILAIIGVVILTPHDPLQIDDPAVWTMVGIIGSCTLACSFLARALDDLFLEPVWDSYTHLIWTRRAMRPHLSNLHQMLALATLGLVIRLFFTHPGRGVLLALICLEGGTAYAACPPSIGNAVATAAAAALIVVIAHTAFILWFSALQFANAHSMDSLTRITMDPHSYESRLRRTAMRWGFPYATVLIVASGLSVFALLDPARETASLSGAATTLALGLPLCLLLTTRLHLGANRRALQTRKSIDPLNKLMARVEQLVDDVDDKRLKGSATCVVKWLYDLRLHMGPSVQLPPNDRLIAYHLLGRLSGPDQPALRRYRRIFELTETLVRAFCVYDPPWVDRSSAAEFSSYDKFSSLLELFKELGIEIPTHPTTRNPHPPTRTARSQA
ncbi:MAG: hypothetical protein R3B57_06900 [Phycisphaerales bacterium]